MKKQRDLGQDRGRRKKTDIENGLERKNHIDIESDMDIENDIDEDDEDFEMSDREKRPVIPALIAMGLILVIGAAGVGMKLFDKYSYSKEIMSLEEYYQVSGPQMAAVILADEVIEEEALISGGEYYLPLSFVQEKLNSRFYYAAKDGLLLYTTPTELYEFSAGSAVYTVSGEERSHSCAVFVMQKEPYLSASFLADYANFVIEPFTGPDRVQIYVEGQTHRAALVNKGTNIRYQGGIKSPILKAVEKGDKVYILEEMETWSKVKSTDGVIGYVENKRLDLQPDEVVEMPVAYTAPEYTSIHKNYTVNMVWHQVTNEVANSGVEELLANTKAVNTISPTWFFLSDNAGGFTSIASQEYVDKMHARGIEVWALIDNFTNDVDIAQILGRLANRKNLITQLMQEAQAYQIDGINIDFEQVPAESGGDYVQFLRELSIACRQNGLVLSVDNYVPTDYTAHYDRREQGTVVDYVVIMGYDEHYSGSKEAGSVASIDYVRKGIENTVAVVPVEKVINAVPFYTRLWKIEDKITSEALSMSAAENYLLQYGATAAWDQVTCQNYATWQAEGITYQIWLEDEESLRAKLGVMSMYPLGGIAQWKLGLEKPQVWDIIESYVQGTFMTDAEAQDEQADGDALPAEPPLEEIVETE